MHMGAGHPAPMAKESEGLLRRHEARRNEDNKIKTNEMKPGAMQGMSLRVRIRGNEPVEVTRFPRTEDRAPNQ